MTLKVKINRVFTNKPSMQAICEIVIDDAVVIHDVRLMEKDGRQYITMPYRKWKDKAGEERVLDVAHPVTAEARQKMLRAVVNAYDSVMEKGLNEEGRNEDVC